jgi:hypothetical protein
MCKLMYCAFIIFLQPNIHVKSERNKIYDLHHELECTELKYDAVCISTMAY